MEKRLYLFSYYFAPLGRADGINRAYLAKYLYEFGWHIDVISCANPHALFRSFQRDTGLLDVLPDTLHLHPVRSPYWGPLGQLAAIMGIARDPFANWRRPALHIARKVIDGPGVLYAIVPPVSNALVAARLAGETGLPLVLDFRDDVSNLPTRVARQAAAFVTSTPASLHNMAYRYRLDIHRGWVIYNGYPVEGLAASNESQHEDRRFRIVYAGLLNLEQDPVMLARALRRMESVHPEMRGRTVIEYYGPPNYYTRLFLRRYLSENIRFHGYRPFAEILSIIRSADAAYTSLAKASKAYCIPSKVFQYIAMETPILAAGVGGALEAFIRKQEIGRYAPATDIDAQADDIYRLIVDRAERDRYKMNLRAIKARYAMRDQIASLDRCLEQLS